MQGEFIKPNWHILLVHYPIALVTVGFIAECIGALFRRPGLRYSARWMVAIGALLGVPTAVLGLYAWREEVVAGAPIDLGNTWGQVVAASAWEPHVFEHVEWHAWLNAAALVLLLFVAVSWIAASPARRAATSFGRIAVTFLAVALLSASAWFGGELVYAHGTGVMTEVGVTAGSVGQPEWLRANLPRLQVHLLGGGFLAALLLLALAQSLRFWREDRDRR